MAEQTEQDTYVLGTDAFGELGVGTYLKSLVGKDGFRRRGEKALAQIRRQAWNITARLSLPNNLVTSLMAPFAAEVPAAYQSQRV